MSCSLPSLPIDVAVEHHRGARPQAPTQRAVSTDRALSSVVSPGAMPKRCCDALDQCAGAFDVAGRAGADHAGMAALGLEHEQVVEGRDAVDLAQRQVQRVGDEGHGLLVEEAEGVLHACNASISACPA
jgi:hypothetical protein